MAGRMLTMAGRILVVAQAGRMLAMAGRTMGSVRGALNDATGLQDYLKMKDFCWKNTPDVTFLSSQSLRKVSSMISNH